MFGLSGLWLLGGFAVVYFIGVFTSQWMKDKIAGIPADLRKALSATEVAAKNDLAAAKAKVVADTATILANAKARVAADLTPKPPAVEVVTIAEKPVVILNPDSVKAAEPLVVVNDPAKPV